jgi:hypothetical protein
MHQTMLTKAKSISIQDLHRPCTIPQPPAPWLSISVRQQQRVYVFAPETSCHLCCYLQQHDATGGGFSSSSSSSSGGSSIFFASYIYLFKVPHLNQLSSHLHRYGLLIGSSGRLAELVRFTSISDNAAQAMRLWLYCSLPLCIPPLVTFSNSQRVRQAQ